MDTQRGNEGGTLNANENKDKYMICHFNILVEYFAHLVLGQQGCDILQFSCDGVRVL